MKCQQVYGLSTRRYLSFGSLEKITAPAQGATSFLRHLLPIIWKSSRQQEHKFALLSIEQGIGWTSDSIQNRGLIKFAWVAVWVRKRVSQSASDPLLFAHLIQILFSRSEIIYHSGGTRGLNSTSSTISSFSSSVAGLRRRKSDRVIIASLYCPKSSNSKELIIRYWPFFSDFLYQLPCL